MADLTKALAGALAPPSKESQLTSADKREAELLGIQDQLLTDTLRVVGDAMAFQNIDPSATRPPDEWIDTLGPEVAERKFRMAKAAWMKPSEAPIGMLLATKISLGIIKAKATEKGTRTLNVAVVKIPSFESYQYPEKEVVDESK